MPAISQGTRRRRRELVARYWLKGFSSREIAEMISHDRNTPVALKSVDFKTVCMDIKYIRTEILEQSDENIRQARSEAIRRLREVQRQAWIEFSAATGLQRGVRPQYLRIIVDAEEKIAKLAGTMAPLQVAGPGGEPLIPQALTFVMPDGVTVRLPDGNGHRADESILN